MSKRVHHPTRRHVRGGRPADAKPGEARPPDPRAAEVRRPAAPPVEDRRAASDEGAAPASATTPRPVALPGLPVPAPAEASALVAARVAEPAPAPADAHRERPGSPGRDMDPAPGPAGDHPLERSVQQPAESADHDDRAGCTAPQLRRFIKSRAYVPMHELRRRFAIEGGDDDVTQVTLHPGSNVYVGLPSREGLLLGELLRAGDVGYELSLDPISPIVVGVFPMRPVPRA